MDIQSLIKDWQDFYKEVFGIEVDFSQLHIPKHQEGFDRLIILAQGMTPQRLFEKCQENFPCQKWGINIYDDLDEIVISERNARHNPYAVWIRNNQEADRELKGISVDLLKSLKIPGITFEERELFELKFFKEMGEHLDIVNKTICSGSHCCHTSTLNVHWHNKFCICRCGNRIVSGFLRSRQVIA